MRRGNRPDRPHRNLWVILPRDVSFGIHVVFSDRSRKRYILSVSVLLNPCRSLTCSVIRMSGNPAARLFHIRIACAVCIILTRPRSVFRRTICVIIRCSVRLRKLVILLGNVADAGIPLHDSRPCACLTVFIPDLKIQSFSRLDFKLERLHTVGCYIVFVRCTVFLTLDNLRIVKHGIFNCVSRYSYVYPAVILSVYIVHRPERRSVIHAHDTVPRCGKPLCHCVLVVPMPGCYMRIAYICRRFAVDRAYPFVRVYHKRII